MNIIKKKIVYGNNDIKNDYFHIVFGIDDDFIRPLGVLMTSILENNRDENIIFHIIIKKITITFHIVYKVKVCYTQKWLLWSH